MTCVYIFLAISLVVNLQGCCGDVYGGAKVVTYGEPCVATRELPIRIEGPKPPMEVEKVPLSLDFRVVSDMFVQPRRVEYPIAIEVPVTPSLPAEKMAVEKDTLRGQTYSYNTYVPPAANPPPPMKHYNFDVEVPVSVKELSIEQIEQKEVPKLKGLTSRIDRILVPACEVSSAPYKCR